MAGNYLAGEAVEKILRENPYTSYTYVAQNAAVERERATKHMRTVARAAYEAALTAAVKQCLDRHTVFSKNRGTYETEQDNYAAEIRANEALLCGHAIDALGGGRPYG